MRCALLAIARSIRYIEMKIGDVRVCIMRIEGTWSEDETHRAFLEVGAKPEIVHIKQLIHSEDIPTDWYRDLNDYQILIFPGGFSAGDCVRAGAIWAARCRKYLQEDIVEFIREGKALGGICNGFQVMVELGLLPSFDDIMTSEAQIALAPNKNGKFECRPSILKNVNNGKCAFTWKYKKGQDLLIPVAHGEGRFTVPVGEEKRILKELEDNDQIVFKYAKPTGELANEEYPYNPNGSLADIAGICNPEGNVFGMMPHPERTTQTILHHDWTRKPGILNCAGDGRLWFESVVEYVAKKL